MGPQPPFTTSSSVAATFQPASSNGPRPQPPARRRLSVLASSRMSYFMLLHAYRTPMPKELLGWAQWMEWGTSGQRRSTPSMGLRTRTPSEARPQPPVSRRLIPTLPFSGNRRLSPWIRTGSRSMCPPSRLVQQCHLPGSGRSQCPCRRLCQNHYPVPDYHRRGFPTGSGPFLQLSGNRSG